jgi:hypothetical protein
MSNETEAGSQKRSIIKQLEFIKSISSETRVKYELSALIAQEREKELESWVKPQ